MRCWKCQLAILFGIKIKMAWALQFFVLGCLAVVTYESHHHARYFKNTFWICIIKGAKIWFIKWYPNVLSYKFDMYNGYKNDILFTDALLCNTFRKLRNPVWSASWANNSRTVRASDEVLKEGDRLLGSVPTKLRPNLRPCILMRGKCQVVPQKNYWIISETFLCKMTI